MSYFEVDNPIKNEIRIDDVTIFPSFDCNLNCNYCVHKNNENKFHKNTKEKLSIENFYNFTQMINMYRHPDNTLHILINGGEPTLDWQYFYNYTLILKSIPNCELSLVTNLTLDYSKEQIEFMGAMYSEISISLDSSEITHDKVRGLGSFNKTINNLMTFASIFPNKVFINRTISENNAGSFLEDKKFLDSLKLEHSTSIDFFSPKKDAKNFVQTLLKQFAKTALEFGSLDFLNFITKNKQYCLDKHLSFSVFPSGEISHCGLEYDKKKIYLNLNDFPNMKFNVTNYDKIKSNDFYDKTCEDCKAKDFCRTGCYAAFKESRDVFCSIMVGIKILEDEFNEYTKEKL